MTKKLVDFLDHFLKEHETLSAEKLREVIDEIEKEYQAWFLETHIEEIEKILLIDHRLPVRELLEKAAEYTAHSLGTSAATIRVLDPESLRMISFGSAGLPNYDRQSSIDVQDSIAGLVVREKRVIAVPSILTDSLYKEKSMATERGFHSMLAVPLITPTPMSSGDNILGTIQIYYREDNRTFEKFEIIHAELLARRISFVLAKKKIFDLEELNIWKETIVNKIFVKLSRRETIKLKDLFELLIPELQRLINIKSCSLFTVSNDQRSITLETTYPQDDCYHEVGHNFTVSHHPYFLAAVMGTEEKGDWPHERITPSYILIKNPSQSKLISKELDEFTSQRQIHSILLVPLNVDQQARHLLAFYATEQKEFFSDDEIELLTFFGKEIMKATRLEFMGDVLHDIKNPAIAVAGFAARTQKLLQSDDLESVREKLSFYVNIIASESARMQDLALAMSGEGREEILDLADIAEERNHILEEVVQELRLKNVMVAKAECEKGLLIYCPRFGLERIIDNLLGNAARAVPEGGGIVSIRCNLHRGKACLSVENTGEIDPSRLEEMKKGAVKGRGLNIITRYVHANHGDMEIEVRDGMTRFIITLPLAVKHKE
jgi:signal transduction histidine kinase